MKAKRLVVPLALVGLAIGLAGMSQDQKATSGDPETDRIVQGLKIAPVHLTLRNRDRDLVGLGSYIVNAQAACNDCHTSPPYADGGNPFMGQPKQFDTEHYLAGGTAFGPFISDNITPDAQGLPAGLTLAEFKTLMRTGHAPDLPAGQVLHVMPWPIFQSMTDRDLRAIYEYLRSIPHAEPAP